MLPVVATIPALFGFLGSLIAKIFIARLAIRLLVIAAATAMYSTFLATILDLIPNINSLGFHPAVYRAIAILPANTSTYITVAFSMLLARWSFVSGMKALKMLTGG